MPAKSSTTMLSNQRRFIPLRYRFVATTTALLILLLGLLALTLGYWQSRIIKNRLKERGLDIAKSLSATSVTTLINYNYIALEQLANKAAQDPEIIYIIVHDKEGLVAGYSGRPDLQRKSLGDKISKHAIAAIQPLTQKAVLKNVRYPVLDVAVPVIASQSGIKWGTIRVGLSFAAIYRQVRQLTAIILIIGIVALGSGILVAFWSARKITRPLKRLVDATVEASHGTLGADIDIHTADEIEILANNFSSMVNEILRHKKKLEAQLAEIRHMHKYTDKLLTTMNDGLLSFSTDGQVNSINPAALDMLGVAQSRTVVGSPILSLVGHHDSLRQYVHQKMAQPSSAPHDEIQLRNQDRDQVIIVGTSILENETGNAEELILNLHDITERKKMETRVRQAERLAALGTLAAGMAHEIRNPLSAIKTFVQLLPRKISKVGFLDKFNRTVPREINRINLLVEDLLDLARKPQFNFSETNIQALLQQNIELMEEDLANQDIKCLVMGPDQLPMVLIDKHQMNKAFQNLIRNATQAMPDGGQLTITTQWQKELENPLYNPDRTGDWVSIVFEDTGIGIDENAINEIFNPFFTSKDQGTGLGLAITHKVVTEHGGYIEAASKVRKGTRFTIHLKSMAPDT